MLLIRPAVISIVCSHIINSFPNVHGSYAIDPPLFPRSSHLFSSASNKCCRPSGRDAAELLQAQKLVPFQKARAAPMGNGIVQLFVGREEDQFAVRDHLQL
jgi:hypothetical protein